MKILIAAHIQNNFLYGNRSVASHIMDGYKHFFNTDQYFEQNPEEVKYIIKEIKR